MFEWSDLLQMANLKNPEHLGELKEHIPNLMSEYKHFLTELADENQHKAANLYYWLKDYKVMLKREENFQPICLKKYSRGDIIKVNLGFNIGSEQGGLHYAIVVEENPRSAGTVTVVPMKSIKDHSPSKWYELDLGTEFMMALKNKTFRLIEEGLKFVQDYGGMIEQENFAEQLRLHDKRIIKINECTEQIQNMKSGSIALIKQITTVSKIRIVDPVKKDDVLSGIRLSAETLSALDNKIAKCFTKLNIDTK